MNDFNKKQKRSAFTLVEMLVVIAILGFVGTASFSMISTAIRTKNTLAAQEDILFNGIRLWQWIERDIEQLLDRKARNALGEQQHALVLNNDELHFSKTGWANPLQLGRSELQRIHYRFDSLDNVLLRTFWPVMDIDQDTKQIEQVFSGVTDFKVELLDSTEQWQTQWPASQGVLLPGQSEVTITMPSLAKITLTIEGLGAVSRVFLIPRYPYEKNNF